MSWPEVMKRDAQRRKFSSCGCGWCDAEFYAALARGEMFEEDDEDSVGTAKEVLELEQPFNLVQLFLWWYLV